MQLSGLPIDPMVQSRLPLAAAAASNVNNFDVGNSAAARLLNTAGYRFNPDRPEQSRSVHGRGSTYAMTGAHRSKGSSATSRRPTTAPTSTRLPERPLVYTSSDPKRFALAWRWAASSRLNNEMRGGANLAPVAFVTDWDFGAGVLYNTVLGITNPIGGYRSRGGAASRPRAATPTPTS